MKSMGLKLFALFLLGIAYPQAGFSTGLFGPGDGPLVLLLILGFFLIVFLGMAFFGWIISYGVSNPYLKRLIYCACAAVVFAVPITHDGHMPMLFALFGGPNSVWLVVLGAISVAATTLVFYGIVSFCALENDSEVILPHPLHSLGALALGLSILTFSFTSSSYNGFFLKLQKNDIRNTVVEKIPEVKSCEKVLCSMDLLYGGLALGLASGQAADLRQRDAIGKQAQGVLLVLD